MRKLFYKMRVRTLQGGVQLAFYKSTPLFLSALERDKDPVIRIYRKEEPGFTFNQDYEEYFDGLSMSGAELRFEGRLEAENGRKYTFVDEDVRVGSTYVYWVCSDRGEPAVGPAAVRVRDPDIWWSQDELTSRMERLAAEYPQLVRMESYGHSARGRELQGLIIGRADRCAAFIGLIHPGESGPELIVPAAERLLKERPELLASAGLALLPAVAADERERLVRGHPGYLRTNANGVDVNRNFPADWDVTEYTYGLITSDPDAITYRGPRPASEPETRAVMAFIAETSPQCVFSFHCLASLCGPAFYASKHAAADSTFAQRSLPLLEAYTDGFYGTTGDSVQLRYVCTAGSLPTWLYKDCAGVPGFDLEWEGLERSKLSHTDETTRVLMEEYRERHYRGIAAMLSILGGGFS